MRIVQYGTYIPIEGATVYHNYGGCGGFGQVNSVYTLIDVEVTDSTGYVQWDKDAGVTDICAEAEGYYGSCGYGTQLNMPKVKDGLYRLTSNAWIKFNIVDDVPYNSDTKIYVSTPWDSDFDLLVISFRLLPYAGFRNDSLFVAKRSILTDSLISIETVYPYVSAFDTLDYIYHY